MRQILKLLPMPKQSTSYPSVKFNQCSIRELTTKMTFKFSEKKPLIDEQNSFIPKHKQTDEKKQYMQNAKMPEDEEEKQSPLVPSSFGNYFLGISCVALLLAYALMQIQFMRADKSKKSNVNGAKKVIAKGKAHIGGQWELLDMKGEKITNKKFEGSYYLIYFGFCNCPDICPNSLTKLSQALEKVKKTAEAKFYNIESIFVSVDPDRDTGEKIQKFVKFFNKDMIGVTGKDNQDPALKNCMKKFKIYSSKIEFEDEDSVVKGRKSYTIDHTILTYLMNPQNQYLAHIGANLGEHDIMKLILDKIKEDQKSKINKLRV